MSAFQWIVGVALPPITFVIFFAAMLSRLTAWRKLPKPGMTLFPTSSKGTAAGVLKETLLFPSLFRSDRFLWATSWLFHAMLALIVIGHLRVVTDFPWLWSTFHVDADTMSAVVGGAAGVMILAMLVLLIGRRVATPRVREISAPGDYFAVFLLKCTNEMQKRNFKTRQRGARALDATLWNAFTCVPRSRFGLVWFTCNSATSRRALRITARHETAASIWPTGRILIRGSLAQLALERTAMNSQTARGLGDVSVAVGQDAVDVFPLRSGQRRDRLGLGTRLG